MDTTVSRRRFLKGLATAAVVPTAAGWKFSRGEEAAAREKLYPFRHADVRLTSGPLKAQFERVHAYYLGLDEDRLLKGFRQRAGLPAPGEEMGGWYGPDGFAPAHCFGQYVSGLARFAAATGDAPTKAKVRRLVEGFAATVGSDGFAYMNARASVDFPAYILDKYEIGLLDAYQLAGVAPARGLLERIIQGSVRYLPPQAIEQDGKRKQGPWDESYTLPENLFLVYELTGEGAYRELARKYLFDGPYFDPLARGVNVLPGLHAYSHVNSLSSAAKAYQVLGDAKYLRTIQNAWDMLETTQEFASGGWGPGEHFVEPQKGKLGESLNRTHAHFETPCGAYAHFKLARYLLRFTGEARYGDGLERVLYNTILGAKDPGGDGQFFYYSDYHPSGQKTYFPDKWPCCSGTLPQAVADYLISAYFRAADGICVNLFVPSEVSWKAGEIPVRLIQSTDYPESSATELRIEVPAPTEFTVRVRIPGWLPSPASIEVNGRAVSEPAERGTFAVLRRRWQNHDTVRVDFPLSFRSVPVDAEHPDLVALMRGPVMLVARAPLPRLPRGAVSSPQGLTPLPGTPRSFELPSPAERLRFMPFYAVQDQFYTTYVREI